MKLWSPTSTTGTSSQCLLVGDIGGTNARFAIANPDTTGFSNELTLQCQDYDSADIAINAYLEETRAAQPDIVCIAAAGPIVDGGVRFTNNDWGLEESALTRTFQGAKIKLLNDFEAIAYSIPHLSSEDRSPIGLPGSVDLDKDEFMIGIVGPGTGLGTAGLHKKNGQMTPIIGEGGHNGFAPETQVQMDILAILRERYDRVCDERLVSGPGVVNIYHALARLWNHSVSHSTAAEIFAHAYDHSDEMAQEAVGIFFEVLGQVAGNLALTLGAFDGVYIAGGIVGRKPELIANSLFRAGFERKGRHRSILEKTPTSIIVHPHPGLLGASYFALQMTK
jgi:glucokinase